MTLYRIEAGLKDDIPDPAATALAAEFHSLGLRPPEKIRTARLYWLEAEFDRDNAMKLARDLFCDTVVEKVAVNEPIYDDDNARLVEVVRKPGVMDPVVASIRKALGDRKFSAGHIATGRKYLLYYSGAGIDRDSLMLLGRKVLANECIEEIHIDKPAPVHAVTGQTPFVLRHVPLAGKNEQELADISKQGCLSLTVAEMRAIQKHYADLQRDPTDVELETIAQTWSEHCRHKTMRGTIDFYSPAGKKHYDNLLKETIVRATETIGHRSCLSVFKDNAGVVAFDEQWALTFKVETHNHPSAIEPYGGAGTGIGGVIRDTMGTGLGAKPIANTDVFCFGMPDIPHERLPAGTLHPKRIMSGVVAGVRDYGNRMGIPTVNGAVHFDQRYVGNPLVYAGSVGLIPREKIAKKTHTGDLIVVLGGRTGRDGIHGATFSSIELSENSEMVSSGAVQIGNAIEEKKVLDLLLKARDAGLYTCVTDCGAGGLSSAVGEMGEELGAVVELEKVPLKYAGLSYTEIWISEAQERMVVSVPPAKWPEFEKLCNAEDVEGTVIGVFGSDKILRLKFNSNVVGELSMEFLHGGLPSVLREATWTPPDLSTGDQTTLDVVMTMQEMTGLDLKTIAKARSNPSVMYTPLLRKILAHPTVASKQWIVRQYDHEVQGRTVVKPLTGVKDDGPSDAAVLTPVLGSSRGFAVACGLCPQFTERDPREMAKLAVDECVRNLVAVGGNPDNTFILDNFSWGNTSKPEQLGSLVLACEGATEAAIAYGTPFISGKDSLNNEYTVFTSAGGQTTGTGTARTIAIPGTLLISGLAMIDEVRLCVTMDFKKPGNLLYVVGLTRDELGGSHLNLLTGALITAGHIPTVDLKAGKLLHKAMHRAIVRETVRACHDLSEGGLAVAAAEMAFAGGVGAHIELARVPVPRTLPPNVVLFSESPSRYLVEVPRESRQDFESIFAGLPHACVGEVLPHPVLQCFGPDRELWIDDTLDGLKAAWQSAF
ncbi:MAG TPA: phosphoribosylformylglycinamidine synthase subunit PurL [Planctomycetota bacterium]|nr:phosphoribosylformylglycinamidine synthase subunit PurL [Planctomycetota bacterium]